MQSKTTIYYLIHMFKYLFWLCSCGPVLMLHNRVAKKIFLLRLFLINVQLYCLCLCLVSDIYCGNFLAIISNISLILFSFFWFLKNMSLLFKFHGLLMPGLLIHPVSFCSSVWRKKNISLLVSLKSSLCHLKAPDKLILQLYTNFTVSDIQDLFLNMFLVLPLSAYAVCQVIHGSHNLYQNI